MTTVIDAETERLLRRRLRDANGGDITLPASVVEQLLDEVAEKRRTDAALFEDCVAKIDNAIARERAG